MHILSPETDNCPSWISGRERMTVENISWSISTKECCWLRRGLNPRPPGLQSDGASNWATYAAKYWSDLCNFYSKLDFWNFFIRKHFLLFFTDFESLMSHWCPITILWKFPKFGTSRTCWKSASKLHTLSLFCINCSQFFLLLQIFFWLKRHTKTTFRKMLKASRVNVFPPTTVILG